MLSRTQTARSLLSLLTVYLTENYQSSSHSCDECNSTRPTLQRTFLIHNRWICLDCIIKRIESEA
ncbi:MAG: hypothetical protein DRO87_03075 [Candidatus Thorarchaeota archaeon]|nr:MAG: hypothetical protein DRP09_08185 [Candidatus Thorarchaeota archaeon]RLI59392.1 MAG: hypothetical protein DRO87_03075 [Candidatus Thorarchaeota archaeon]